jgi:hypothetical protein
MEIFFSRAFFLLALKYYFCHDFFLRKEKVKQFFLETNYFLIDRLWIKVKAIIVEKLGVDESEVTLKHVLPMIWCDSLIL